MVRIFHDRYTECTGKEERMKKSAGILLLLAFSISFLCACNAYTPGPSTTRSQVAPVSVPPTELVETPAAPTETQPATTTAAPVTTAEDPAIWHQTEEVTTEEVKVYVYAVADVNVRTAANKNSDIIATLSYGDKVEKIGEEGSWFKIIYNDQEAFVYGTYLSEEEP